ncbi:MAG: NAD(P)/FAD-dependent oxidoreductase [Novosphingobium sp.]
MLVIGAGISGALVAQDLAEAGLSVIVVDRRGPAAGSTAASTALVQYELDLPLHQLIEQIGQDRAERAWRRARLAVDALRERAWRLGIEAGQASRDTLYLAGNLLGRDGLEHEAAARRRCGFELELLGPAATKAWFGLAPRHALLSFGNYAADPRALTAGLLKAAIGRRARVFAPAEVIAIEPGRSGVTAQLRDGPELRAKTAVFATGYELVKGVPRMGHALTSTWTIATAPQPNRIWPGAAMIWEAADPYLYIRTTPQGHVICGGDDSDEADAEVRDALTPAKTKTLARKLGRLIPGIDPTPAYAWAGTFGTSPLSMPTIGRVPGMPGCYAALGYGGNGITFAMIAAQVLRGLICGDGDPDSDLFGFSREF